MSDLNVQVKFNLGEGITSTDLNDAQTVTVSGVTDCLVAGKCINASSSLNIPAFSNKFCYSPGNAGFIKTNGTSMTVTNTPGLICQWVSNNNEPNNGAGRHLLYYYLFLNELQTTFANPHATLYRIDCIDVKLSLVDGDPQDRDFKDATTGALSTQSFDKKQRVTLDISVTQGTAATIGSVVPAAIPTGYCRWGGIIIPPGSTFTPDVTHICDWVLPMNGVESYWLSAQQMVTESSPTVDDDSVNLTGANDAARALSPIASPFARLVRAYSTVNLLTTGTISSAYTKGLGSSITSIIAPTLTINNMDTFLDSSNLTLPLWANGTRCGRAAALAASPAGYNQSLGAYHLWASNTVEVQEQIFEYMV